jgi:hypothetical protein
VAEAIGATPHTLAADWEFACKAGTEAMQAAIGFVGSRMADYALSIGADTAQGRPGDALEYTAGAGGAAFLLGPAEDSLAEIEATYSFATDTPDFWRRSLQTYQDRAFTNEPAYQRVAAASECTHALRPPEDFSTSFPAEHQIPAAGGQGARIHPGRSSRHAGAHQQHLRQLGLARPGSDPMACRVTASSWFRNGSPDRRSTCRRP